ncbi:hypothetical protein B7L68_06985 [Thermoproteus sp. CP80]|nr:hypothetical protein B7L68_06985 [Thermoproteus sp. CP80]
MGQGAAQPRAEALRPGGSKRSDRTRRPGRLRRLPAAPQSAASPCDLDAAGLDDATAFAIRCCQMWLCRCNLRIGRRL